MLKLQHDIVSVLYSVKSMLESHLEQVREGLWQDEGDRLRHAEEMMKAAYRQTKNALEVTKMPLNRSIGIPGHFKFAPTFQENGQGELF